MHTNDTQAPREQSGAVTGIGARGAPGRGAGYGGTRGRVCLLAGQGPSPLPSDD